MVDGVAFVPYAITDLGTEIEYPSAYIATEIKMHQYRQLYIMQVVIGVCNGIISGSPAAVHVVQLHLKMAVFMPGQTEHQTAVAA